MTHRKSPSELKEVLKGVNIIQLTSFKSATELDEEGLRSNTRFMIENGIVEGKGVLIPDGSNSECYNMSISERNRVVEIVVDEANGDVPVVPGRNHSSTNLVIDLVKHAEEVGADGVMVMPPYYQTPDDTAIYKHYEAIAEQTNLGIMIYNNPTIVRRDIPFEVLEKLAEIDNIIGLKECTRSFRKMVKVIRELSDKIAVIDCGGIANNRCSYLLGGKGHITRIANFGPQLDLDLYEASLNNNTKKFYELYDKMTPLNDLFGKVGETQAQALCKEAMRMVGLSGGDSLRLPMYEPNQEQKDTLRNLLVDMGLLE